MEDKLSKENAIANNLTYDEWQAGKKEPADNNYGNNNNRDDSLNPVDGRKEAKAYDPSEIGREKAPEDYLPCKKAGFSADKCRMVQDESCKDCKLLNLKTKE